MTKEQAMELNKFTEGADLWVQAAIPHMDGSCWDLRISKARGDDPFDREYLLITIPMTGEPFSVPVVHGPTGNTQIKETLITPKSGNVRATE